jgi:hypothetical protein
VNATVLFLPAKNMSAPSWFMKVIQAYKTCLHCVESRNWLANDADWPDDIDGEGHQWFYTMLREHLMEQARNGAHKFAFRAYRHIALMDNDAKTLQVRITQKP